MPKIYIIGSVGSGKTTLAKRLSKELNINYYELDNVTWEYNPNGNDRRRNDKEVIEIFEKIINQKDWIIENVGKDIYSLAYEKADTIIYIDLPKKILYKRIIYRWIKQKLKLYPLSIKPTLRALKQMLLWAKSEKQDSKLKKLHKYDNKIVILDEKELNEYKYVEK